MGYKYQRDQEYTSRFQGEIDKLNEEYNNKQFSYDPSSDSAYQDYFKMMQASGQKAMRDTMGKATALTGGYGNSYATTVGQQVYNDYIAQASGAQEDFYDRALSRFATEQSMLKDKINNYERLEANDKAQWEEDYAKDLAKQQAAKGKDLGEEQIAGLIDAANNGTLQEYITSLSHIYDITEINAYVDMLKHTGKINSGYSYDDTKDTWNYDEAQDTSFTKSAAVNNAIGGLGKLKEGQNFHISRIGEDNTAFHSTEYGDAGNNFDVQLGAELDTDSEEHRFLKDKDNGIVLYDGELYYVSGNRVFEVSAQKGRADEYENLLKYMKGVK